MSVASRLDRACYKLLEAVVELKVKLRISGETLIHCCSPVLPSHTLCGDQHEEDDGGTDTELLGFVDDKARVTCEGCKEIVRHCKNNL